MQDGNAASGREPNPTIAELRTETAALLLFCRENTTAVAAAIVFLTGCCIHSYSMTADAAINIFSADLISAIPIVFSSLVVISLLLLFFVLAPTLMLFEGAHKDRHGRIHPILQPQNFNLGHRRRALPAVRRISLARLVVFAIPGVVLALWALAEALLDEVVETGLLLLFIAALIAIASNALLAGRLRRPQRHRTASPDLGTRALSSTMQTVLMLFVLVLALTYTTDRKMGDALTFFILLVAPVFTASSQVVLVMLISRLSGTQGFIRRIFFFAAIFVAAFCVFPPTSSLLLKTHFMNSATAHGSCFRLMIDPTAPLPKALIDVDFKSTDGQTWSKQLQAIAPIEDWIQIRLKTDDTVLYRISKHAFAQTISCADEPRLRQPAKTN